MIIDKMIVFNNNNNNNNNNNRDKRRDSFIGDNDEPMEGIIIIIID